MNKDKFCEELYSQFPEIIVPGKRGVLVPISMLVVGVALFLCLQCYIFSLLLFSDRIV